MPLSRFFELSEMTFSKTARDEGIPNQPGAAQIESLQALCTAVLDPLRESIGQAIRINSGFRGPELNRRVGGESSSQHLEGKASDIQAPGVPVLELFKSVIRLGLPFDQLIYENKSPTAKWVHVSHNPGGNRADIRVAEFTPAGKVIRYRAVTREEALAMTERVSRAARMREFEYIEMGDEPVELPAPAPAPKAERPAARGKPRAPKKVAAAPRAGAAAGRGRRAPASGAGKTARARGPAAPARKAAKAKPAAGAAGPKAAAKPAKSRSATAKRRAVKAKTARRPGK